MNRMDYNQEILGEVLEKALVTPLKQKKCALSMDEIKVLVRMTCHIEQNISEVCHITGWSARTLERRWKESDFPKPHKNASDKLVWWLDECEIWLSEHPDSVFR